MIKKIYTSIFSISAFSTIALADISIQETTTPNQAIAAEANIQSFLESIQTYRQLTSGGKIARASNLYYYNTEDSKIKVLYGKWQLTYQTSQPSITSLEIDGTFLDNSFGYYGWDSKSNISCFYEPNILNSIYSYQCLQVKDATTGNAERLLFNISGNILIGKYHTGSTIDFITRLNANQLQDFKGTANKCSEPCFDESTGELSIPKVTASGKAYRVIMQRERNGLFSVQSVNAL